MNPVRDDRINLDVNYGRLGRPISNGVKKYWIGIILLVLLVAVPVTAYSDAWTFMVYLDGDNNLESAAIDDFLEMAEVGSDINVNIIVQMDRVSFEVLDAIGQGAYDDTSYGNWTTTKRFRVDLDSTPVDSDSGFISDEGELNMGDPNTLSDFVDWATTTYPATNYALILWNHGGGWRDAIKAKGLNKDAIKAICWDETDNADCLYMNEVKSALLNITEHMHLIGFDACLMGMIEVAHQIYSYGSVMVGSETIEPNDGWPYDTILSATNGLVKNPNWTANQLGDWIVDTYIAQTAAAYKTQSAIDLTKINALASAVDSFAQALGYDSDIANARANVEDYYYPAHIDLYHFAYLCKQYSSNSTIDSRAQTVMDNVTSAVITEGHGTDHPNSHGLAIYFPSTEASYDSDYGTLSINSFATTNWDEFLSNYYNQVAPPGGDGGTTGTGGGGSSGGKVCFIATAAYGSYTDEHGLITDSHGSPITVLQKFRDEYLLTNAPGRAFVSYYERMSPPIARYIENKEALKAIIRFYLKPVVWLTKKVTSNPSVTETLNN